MNRHSCSFSGGDNVRWYEHSNPNSCLKNILNFFALLGSGDAIFPRSRELSLALTLALTLSLALAHQNEPPGETFTA